jgi:flagellar hook-length control protein FliK
MARASGITTTAAGAAAAARGLGSGEFQQGDSTSGAGGVSGTAIASGAPEGTQLPGQAQINLALAEGTDATGAAALQAANAAASSAPTSVPAPLTSIGIPSITGDAFAASVSATGPVSAALPSAEASTGLASDGGSHEHGEAGDAGAGVGGNAGDGSAALQQLSTVSASSSSNSTPVATLRVHASVDSADFPQAVTDRVSFAVDNNWTSTKLQVNPPQLGPIDLQIAVQGDHAQVMMSTHSAVTREALESSLPKLKEMLSSQGFTQVSVDISQRSFQDRSAFSQPYIWTKAASGASSPVTAAAPVAVPSSAAPRSMGVLDAYA